MNGRKKKVLLALLLAIALVGGVVMAKGYPDWATDVIQHEGTTFVVTGDVDANITNSQLDVNVTNSQLDVNVTNSQLDVNVAGTADVEIQNANVNVKTLRERVLSPDDLDGLDWSATVGASSWEATTLYTNNESTTVYLEYLTIATSRADPNNVAVTVEIKNSSDAILFRLYCAGKEFLNFDPAIPVPPGGYIHVIAVNNNSTDADVYVSGIVRKIS